MPEQDNKTATVKATASLPVAHLDQYLGIWAMYEPAFQSALHHARTIDLAAHIQNVQAQAGGGRDRRVTYAVNPNGIAVFEMVGSMTKYGSSLSSYPGSVQLRRGLREATADDQVKGIMLRIDSPGGTVAGTGDLADDVRAAAAQKPVTAYIEDTGASAAYMVASQASQVVAGPDAVVGSIGVYAVIDDWSQAYAKAGVKTYVIRSGKFKGAGAEGAELTPEQLEHFQTTINAIHELFVERVMRGRRMTREQVEALADGSVYIGEQARARGLVGAIQSFDAAMADLARSTNNQRSRGATAGSGRATAPEAQETRSMSEKVDDKAVAEQPSGPQAATFAELKQALGDATAEFREECMERNLTVAQAKDRWSAHLSEQLKAKDAELEKVKAEQAKLADAKKANTSSVEALGDGAAGAQAASETGDVIERFEAAVAEKVKAGLSKPKAVRAVVVGDPDLHEAYLAASNEGRGGSRQ